MGAFYESVGLTAPVAMWSRDFGDFLVKENPLWFKAVIWGELVLQLPACFVLGVGWLRRSESVKAPSLIYAVHVLTTMIPIMTVFCCDPRPTLTCLLVYGIWVLLPFLLLVRVVAAGDG